MRAYVRWKTVMVSEVIMVPVQTATLALSKHCPGIDSPGTPINKLKGFVKDAFQPASDPLAAKSIAILWTD